MHTHQRVTSLLNFVAAAAVDAADAERFSWVLVSLQIYRFPFWGRLNKILFSTDIPPRHDNPYACGKKKHIASRDPLQSRGFRRTAFCIRRGGFLAFRLESKGKRELHSGFIIGYHYESISTY